MQMFKKMMSSMPSYSKIQDVPAWQEKPEPSSPDEEDSFLSHHFHREKRPWDRWGLRVCLSVGVIGIACLAIASIILLSRLDMVSRRSVTPFPEFPTHVLILEADESYEAPASPESDYLWDSNLPGGKGFILIDEPGRFSLPPGLPSPNNGTGVYGVTWTHEYHCLKLLRMEFWNAIYGTSDLYGGERADPPLPTMAMRRLQHAQHCMDYIRQLVMCRADMTIEWAAPDPDQLGNKHHINGYGIPHKCTKWDDVYQYMMDNQAPRFRLQDDHDNGHHH